MYIRSTIHRQRSRQLPAAVPISRLPQDGDECHPSEQMNASPPKPSKPWIRKFRTATDTSDFTPLLVCDLYFVVAVWLRGSATLSVARFSLHRKEGRRKLGYMTGATEGLPMDVAKDARGQQQEKQQQEDQKEELDRNESVRARLLAISQVEPVGDEVSVDDAIQEVKESPRASPTSDKEDEFRRRLMAISYTDAPRAAQ